MKKKDYPKLTEAERIDRFEELKRNAAGRWPEIIKSLSHVDISETIDAAPRPKHIRCHNNHGDTKNQFRIFQRDFADVGGGICNTCGSYSNGFALLTYLNGWDFKQAIREVAQFLEGRGFTTDRPQARKTETPEKKHWQVSKDALAKLGKVWDESRPIKGTVGERYLRNRQLTCDLPSPTEVRFHDSLFYWDEDKDCPGGNHPAMVSLLRTAKSGQPITVHRTYLDETGQKAKVRRSKKLMTCAIDGAISELGAAIRLYPTRGTWLAVAEGIETCLAVRSAHEKMPIWACYSASVMSNFQPPEGIENVLIWGDLDAKGAGQLAAAKLALRLQDSGVNAHVLLPGQKVYVPNSRSNGWFSKEHTRGRIVNCLTENGYEVTEEANLISKDWHDVWSENPNDVRTATNEIRKQCA